MDFLTRGLLINKPADIHVDIGAAIGKYVLCSIVLGITELSWTFNGEQWVGFISISGTI